MRQDRQMQMIGGLSGNHVRQYAGQITGNQNGYNSVQNNANQNENGHVVVARAEGNAYGNTGNQIRDIDKIAEVNAKCILMANLQQTSTSGSQIDRALIYDSDGSSKILHS
uniref:Reverse transcriptase domain-containing protein n=1 Tax=Tanacetum cinerariifolium TaxID=118510 RepID=A0A699I4M6_TANCI|nr:hypothetical protein [Tanacetum cinerariifolium]